MRRRNPELAWHRVHWPQPTSSTAALALLDQLATRTRRGAILFEARASDGHVRYFIGCSPYEVSEVSRALRHLVPLASVEAEPAKRRAVMVSTRLTIENPQLSLAVAEPGRTNKALLSALSAASSPGEELILQLVVGRGIPPRLDVRPDRDPTQSTFDALLHGNRKPSPTTRRALQDKRASLGLVARIRVGSRATSEGRSEILISGVLAALRLAQSPGTKLGLKSERPDLLDDAILPSRGTDVFTCAELIAITAWPIDIEEAPGLPGPHPRQLAPTSVPRRNSRVFATATAPGTGQALGLTIEDALFHTVITGPTGTGKSTALLNLICADLEADRGVVVIDPKSDLVSDVLARVPRHRVDDVVVLDPTIERPVGLNPLAASTGSHHLTADGILAVFRGLFPSMFGPRTSDVLHASLLSLAEIPGATLAWLPRLLTDQTFRTRHLAPTDDESLGGFWANFDSLSSAQQAQFIGPVLSRLRQFLLRPALRRVLDQPAPKFDIGRVFTDRKVLLVPLNTGLLGETAARLLGSLLVTQLWQSTLGRAQIAPRTRTPVAIYVDEAQEFLHLDSDLGDALARSRALGVAWHLAHQYRDQFDPRTLSAIDANARSKVVFTLAARDAKAFAAMVPELLAEDFVQLPRFGIYTQLVGDGHPQPWASGQTLPPPPQISSPDRIVARSQERWGSEPFSSSEDDSPNEPRESIGRRRRQR